MEQLALFDASPHWTVSDLTRHLRQMLDSDDDIQGIWVEGEVSNLSRPASGHIYFTLKDASASLRCVMWRNDVANLRFVLQDGMAIEAHGGVSIYEAGGQYQLYANTLRPMGEGALYREFLRLKALLEAEGLFDSSRKRPIPDRPRRIGIVTSASGAALRDVLNTIRRRNPLLDTVLAPSPVQGDEAPAALVEALRSLNRIAQPDVILLARGGGSIEDLWAFNDERVVRAVTDSTAPVISGIGHETDFTLVDFAADLRAPTPTAAAELATSVTVTDLAADLKEMAGILAIQISTYLDQRRSGLNEDRDRLILFSPMRRIQDERQRLDEMIRRGNSAEEHCLKLAISQLTGLEKQLLALNPEAVLGRGYSIVSRASDDKLITHKTQVRVGDALRIRLQDGEIGGQVTSKSR